MERFHESAKRTLVRAGLEARALNHSFIATEHVLLALAHDETTTAGAALRAHGINRRRVRKRVLRLVDRGPDTVTGPTAFSPRVREVIEIALLGRFWDALPMPEPSPVRDQGLLLALLLHGDGIAAEVLRELGVTIDTLANALRLAHGVPLHAPDGGERRLGRSYLLGDPDVDAA